MGTAATDRGAELQRAILDEARRRLVENGYTGLSMRRIADAVGCTATSIYLYFQDKDALFHALIDEGMEMLHRRLSKIVGSTSPGRERVEALCRAYVAFGLDNPEFYEIMFMLHPKHTQRFPPENYRRARRNLELFVDALSDLPSRGDDSHQELRLAATAAWSALHGTVSLLVTQRVDARIERHALVDETVRLAVGGVAGVEGAAGAEEVSGVEAAPGIEAAPGVEGASGIEAASGVEVASGVDGASDIEAASGVEGVT